MEILSTGFFPKNITGFGKEVKQGHILKEPKTLFYQAAREAQAEIISWKPPTYPKNFYEVLFVLGKEQFSCFIHEYYAYAGFQNKQGEYVDCEQLSVVLSPTFICLTAEMLEEQFQAAYFSFDEQEQSQCTYWQPEKVGEVIFNCWD
ncbi:hypothetical protein [Enterococcus sp. BWR-S5]|uniref:hypothetical protein n=1 Tax=Enterococcus sp. BWR-S5 TaxID=2787714 RepID=UPI001922EC8E|nr:hypothetical protein [Enterococcus sp. BWR-S5]MBL1224535.1 hypothetical protein [Enterococcus sp. BWR-S5]